MSDAITLFLRSKQTSNFRPAYVTSLKQYLALFAKGREHVPITDITTEDIEAWFASRREAPSSQSANLGRLSALFSWCKRRRYITENPCDFIERVRIDRSAPEILTVDQMRKCLEFCITNKPRLLLWFVLAGMVGIRRDELLKLPKDAVKKKLSERMIVIDAAASKVRRRRIVELTEWQSAWIQFAISQPDAELPLPDSYVIKSLRRLRVVLGLDEWPQDILRHTALSHTLAEIKDVGKVAMWSGNSPKILLTHYNGLVMPEDNLKLRNILP